MDLLPISENILLSVFAFGIDSAFKGNYPYKKRKIYKTTELTSHQLQHSVRRL